MIRRAFVAAALALFISSTSASAATATAFGDSFTARAGSWYGKLNLGDNNFAVSGAVCNPRKFDECGPLNGPACPRAFQVSCRSER